MASDEYEMLSAQHALSGLQRTTGLHSRIAGHDVSNAPSSDDGQLVIETEDGRRFDLPYEVKTTVDRRDQLLTFKARHDNAVLITRELSRAMAEQCREHDIQFIDHAGNCFIRQPGFFVFVTGAKDTTKSKQATSRGLTPATLRVVLAVLTLPSILNSNVRRIGEVASISHGAAGSALTMLQEAGLFTTARSGRRVLRMPERWLDAWTEGYLGRIRPKLEKYRMSAPVPISAVLDRVRPQFREVMLGGTAAAKAVMLGGEAAAENRHFGLKPGALTLYIDLRDTSVMRDIVTELKLRRDPEGRIELVDMFWNPMELPGFPTVPDALIYADLIGTGDERTMEIAADLRKEICANLASGSE